MGTFGFSRATIGVYDENEKVVKKYVVDQQGGSTVDANISNISPSSNPIYGSDGTWKNPTKGVGAVQVTFTANALPKDVLDVILGKKGKDGFGHINKDTQPPQCSFDMEAEDAATGLKTHVAVLNGTFSMASIDLKTNTASAVHSPDKLTFKSETRKSDNEVYVDAIEDDSFKSEDWEKLVRPVAAPAVEGEYDASKYDTNNAYSSK